MGIDFQVETATDGHGKSILGSGKSADALMDASEQHMGKGRDRRLGAIGKSRTEEIGEVSHAEASDGTVVAAKIRHKAEPAFRVDGKRHAAPVGVESLPGKARMDKRIAAEKLSRGSRGSLVLRDCRDTQQQKEPKKPW